MSNKRGVDWISRAQKIALDIEETLCYIRTFFYRGFQPLNRCSDPLSNTAQPAMDRAIAEWDAIAGWAVPFTNGANDQQWAQPIHQSGGRPQ